MSAAKEITRSCCACRKTARKDELVRIVRKADSSLELDPSGRIPGRGCYLCADLACFEKASKSNRLANALRVKVDTNQIDRILEGFLHTLKQRGV